jgi:hypothetical protein
MATSKAAPRWRGGLEDGITTKLKEACISYFQYFIF